MPDNKLQGPLLYDSLDRPNAPKLNAGNTPPPKNREPLVWIVGFIIFALFVGGLLIYILSWAHNQYYYDDRAAIILAILQWLIVIVIAGSVFAAVVYLTLAALQKGIWSLDRGVPISVANALKQQLDTTQALNLQMQVMLERAKQSRFQGVTTLTLDESSHAETSTTTVAPVTEETPEDVIGRDKSPLEDMRDKGLINRSDNSLMIGFEA
jgi:hypothetical protein